MASLCRAVFLVLLFAGVVACDRAPAGSPESPAPTASGPVEVAAAAAAVDPALAGPAACTIELAVTGMACPIGCAPRVQKALAAVAGVRGAKVVYEDARATVEAAAPLCADGAQGPLVDAVGALEDFGATVSKVAPIEVAPEG